MKIIRILRSERIRPDQWSKTFWWLPHMTNTKACIDLDNGLNDIHFVTSQYLLLNKHWKSHSLWGWEQFMRCTLVWLLWGAGIWNHSDAMIHAITDQPLPAWGWEKSKRLQSVSVWYELFWREVGGGDMKSYISLPNSDAMIHAISQFCPDSRGDLSLRWYDILCFGNRHQILVSQNINDK